VVLGLIAEFVIEVLVMWTGECVLSVITLGRWQPRLNLYSNEPVTKGLILAELSFWVGGVFWILVGLVVYLAVRAYW
jgi:hypothetical protein